MSDLGTAVTSAMESQPLSQFSFSLFMRLPAELQLEILSHCAQNDLVCLSLSSHALRALTLSLIPEHPWLLSYDQTLPQDALECTCGEKGMTGVAQNARAHRKRHHSYERRIDLSKPYSSRSYLKCHDFSLCRKYPSDHAAYMGGPPSVVCPITAGHIGRVSLTVDAGGGCGGPGVRTAGVIQRETGQRMLAEDEMRESCRGAH
ncbi:F-box domain-containing protein [Diaporthe eres]|nr:F-box domain-containing protein [Diaporthe eres]